MESEIHKNDPARRPPSRDVEGFDSLSELALDLRWSWTHGADKLWRRLDPALWELTQNPWVVLQTVSRDHVASLLAESAFRRNVNDLLEAKRQAIEAPGWFQQSYPRSSLTRIAYFSMEFMLSEALPIYSGGLGNVAGDQLKAAGDLGVPVVGVGLLYQQGYFRQVIDKNGEQQALFPYNDPGQLPITPLRQPNGEWLRLEITLPGYSLWLRAWQVQVGRVKLYLLDSNDAANYPAHRAITGELYGGGPELRLKQELILGIGGWRLLVALGVQPEVCHLNEGHAAFAVLERARAFMQQTSQPFAVALAATRPGNLFTTHTAVAAGFDRFSPDLLEQYLGAYARQKLGISVHDLLALGRQNPNDSSENFNMAYLAIRGSGAVNGVSRLHRQVSRNLFQPLFPRWPEDEVPVEYVTNGVHVPTWDSAAADDLWTRTCGDNRWLGLPADLKEDIRSLSDIELWQFRNAARKSLVDYTRGQFASQLAVAGGKTESIARAKHLFDPTVLTLGFARRFASYKRPNLLLHDVERLRRLLDDSQRPVQIIVAGKAHPEDRPGQALIHEWIRLIETEGFRSHVVFLSDYDMRLTQQLVQGVDVWLNTPRRPWEACGTSGMKVLVNGGINLSELDGWWAEAYLPDLGWAIGDGLEHGADPDWDRAEAAMLYDLLEHEIIPEFYERDAEGIPTAWISRMRESMSRLTPRFSADRTVREYTEQHYLPAAAAYRARAADQGAMARKIVKWEQALEKGWNGLRFGEVKIETRSGRHHFEAQVFVGDLDSNAIDVDLYARGMAEKVPAGKVMKRQSIDASGAHIYIAQVSADRPAADFTPRIRARYEGVTTPLEETRILWQR